jgi:hypothetical protein
MTCALGSIFVECLIGARYHDYGGYRKHVTFVRPMKPICIGEKSLGGTEALAIAHHQSGQRSSRIFPSSSGASFCFIHRSGT